MADSRPPRFEDYPVKATYQGPLSHPKIITAIQRKYRTRIKVGVEKGWGVVRDGKEQDHPGSNFAGNMIVVHWGCGSPCLMMAMVDAGTGQIYSLPLAMNDGLSLPWLRVGNSVGGNPEVIFRRDSRLMVIRATADYFQENHHSYSHFYLWQDGCWHLLYRERMD